VEKFGKTGQATDHGIARIVRFAYCVNGATATNS